MKKVTILGPKSRMSTVIQQLHELELLHIDEYDEEEADVDIGEPMEDAEALSDRLVKLRSIRSRLPPADSDAEDPEAEIDDIGARIDEIENQLSQVREEREQNEALLEKLELVDRLGLDLDDFAPYDTLDIFLGTVERFEFIDELPAGRHELFRDNDLIALFVDTDAAVEEALRSAGFTGIDTAELVQLDGLVEAEQDRVHERIKELASVETELTDELQQLAAAWNGVLEQDEAELSAELEKAEAPLRFATTESAFFAEGWVPAEDYGRLAAALEDATGGVVHIEEVDDGESAPVAHDNPEGVRPLEDLIGFYGVPSYKEIDPTFLLLTFPLLFGFMLGDVGYGLTTFIVFYTFYRMFPGTKGLWMSLMYASVVTIVFGLVYAEMFGYVIFGHESVLAELTGIHLFAEIPVLFHRAHELGTVLTLSVLIGVVHVNLGFLIGMYNEYLHHGLMEAVFAKFSWIVIEIGAVVAYLFNTNIGLGVILVGVVMLFKGEGIEGVVEIPSLLSNILSYLRIFGVSIAIIALAAVVNQMAGALFQNGSIVMAGFGVLILLIGHTINTFLKMMEAGLQGIRLHYVEFFTKFFEGGGTYYRPFGNEGR